MTRPPSDQLPQLPEAPAPAGHPMTAAEYRSTKIYLWLRHVASVENGPKISYEEAFK